MADGPDTPETLIRRALSLMQADAAEPEPSTPKHRQVDVPAVGVDPGDRIRLMTENGTITDADIVACDTEQVWLADYPFPLPWAMFKSAEVTARAERPTAPIPTFLPAEPYTVIRGLFQRAEEPEADELILVKAVHDGAWGWVNVDSGALVDWSLYRSVEKWHTVSSPL